MYRSTARAGRDAASCCASGKRRETRERSANASQRSNVRSTRERRADRPSRPWTRSDCREICRSRSDGRMNSMAVAQTAVPPRSGTRRRRRIRLPTTRSRATCSNQEVSKPVHASRPGRQDSFQPRSGRFRCTRTAAAGAVPLPKPLAVARVDLEVWHRRVRPVDQAKCLLVAQAPATRRACRRPDRARARQRGLRDPSRTTCPSVEATGAFRGTPSTGSPKCPRPVDTVPRNRRPIRPVVAGPPIILVM